MEALQTKNTQVIYEVLIALQKIHDPATAAPIEFLVRDLDDRVQSAALETVGLLQDRAAIPAVRDALDHARSVKVRRAALEALALMPDASLHDVFRTWLTSSDDYLRASAAEGLARLKDPQDQPALEKMFNDETKIGPRLAAAFGLDELGKLDMSALAPLRYLVYNLNMAAWRGVARPYLVELARDQTVRQALYPALTLPDATKDEKTGLAEVLASSGGADSVAPLQALSRDQDADVARAALRALQAVQARTAG